MDIIEQHIIIRETIGYEALNKFPVEDIPKLLEFLKIVNNYNRMQNKLKITMELIKNEE